MGQLDRLEGSRSPRRMTNGAEGLIRKKDEGLTQQGLWMAAGKLLICSFLGGIEVRGQGSVIREDRAINGNPSARQEHLPSRGMWETVCSFVLASFIPLRFSLAYGKRLA